MHTVQSRLYFHLFLFLSIGLGALAPEYARAELLAESSTSSFSVRLDRDKSERILVASLHNATSASVFAVENPTRLVIDIEGLSPARLPLVSVKEDTVVRALRLGVHPGKTRIVIDIGSPLPPHFSWETSERELKVKFSLEAETHTPVEAIRTPTVVPTATVMSQATPATVSLSAATPALPLAMTEQIVEKPAQLLMAPSPLHGTRLRNLPAQTDQPPAPQPVTFPALTGIRFARNQQHLPTLAITLDQRREFRLARLDTKTYRLTIPVVRANAPHLLLPFYPPSDFIGFTHCIPKQRDDGIEVLIGVDRGARAEASVLESTIQIVVNPLPSLAPSPQPSVAQSAE